MAADFADIRIVDLNEEHTTRADPSEPLYDVYFVLSAEAPVGWRQIAQAHLGSNGGRRAEGLATEPVRRRPLRDRRGRVGSGGPAPNPGGDEPRVSGLDRCAGGG